MLLCSENGSATGQASCRQRGAPGPRLGAPVVPVAVPELAPELMPVDSGPTGRRSRPACRNSSRQRARRSPRSRSQEAPASLASGAASDMGCGTSGVVRSRVPGPSASAKPDASARTHPRGRRAAMLISAPSRCERCFRRPSYRRPGRCCPARASRPRRRRAQPPERAGCRHRRPSPSALSAYHRCARSPPSPSRRRPRLVR